MQGSFSTWDSQLRLAQTNLTVGWKWTILQMIDIRTKVDYMTMIEIYCWPMCPMTDLLVLPSTILCLTILYRTTQKYIDKRTETRTQPYLVSKICSLNKDAHMINHWNCARCEEVCISVNTQLKWTPLLATKETGKSTPRLYNNSYAQSCPHTVIQSIFTRHHNTQYFISYR